MTFCFKSQDYLGLFIVVLVVLIFVIPSFCDGMSIMEGTFFFFNFFKMTFPFSVSL
jgi:hypothetical protein